MIRITCTSEDCAGRNYVVEEGDRSALITIIYDREDTWGDVQSFKPTDELTHQWAKEQIDVVIDHDTEHG